MKEKKIRLIRHASTRATAGRRFVGRTDMGLSRGGVLEARRLNRALAGWIGDLWCSPMKRCLETAGHALPERKPTIIPDLREIDFGLWEGLTFEQIRKQDPKGAVEWLKDYSKFKFPKGEGMREFDRRMRALSARMRSHPFEQLVVIAHGGVIRGLLRYLLELPGDAQFRFELSPASVTVVRLSKFGGTLSALNDLSHLMSDEKRGGHG